MGAGIVAMAAVGLAVLAVIGIRRFARGNPDRQPRIEYTAGVTARFGCGHEMRRMAIIMRSDGSEHLREFARPDAGRFNCHRCYLETGVEEAPTPSEARPLN